MTREVAKNWLNKLYARADITDEYGDMEDMQPYEEAVNMAIQALEQTRWIPVSEKLPELCQRVLVTSYGRVCYAMMIGADWNSGYPIFKLQDSLNEKVVCETTVHSEFTTSRIIAWMPLPQPYVPEINVGKMGESEDKE